MPLDVFVCVFGMFVLLFVTFCFCFVFVSAFFVFVLFLECLYEHPGVVRLAVPFFLPWLEQNTVKIRTM